MKPIVIVFLFVLVSSCVADLGVDLSTATLTSSFQCLVAQGYKSVVVRAWKKDATFDTASKQTIANAWAGGMPNVDVYLFPCVSCGDPQGQVRSCVSNLTGSVYNTFWLDVEGIELWNTNISKNIEFFEGMVASAQSLGLKIGVYASKYMWTSIMGSSYSGGSQFPLWYPRYDNVPAFSDFTPFGGWTTPVMKQFLDTTAICGASVDFNYWPPSPSPTPSSTSTPSPTATPSRTPTRTPTTTPTRSATPSPTRSVTPTRSPTRSPSKSPTPTRSPTRTPSVTPSVTPTTTTTPTASATASASTSASASASSVPSVSPTVPRAIPSPQCDECLSDDDCSFGRGVCVSSSIGNYCSCLSGFGGCDCSLGTAFARTKAVLSADECSYSEVSPLAGRFKPNATVDYEYPNLFVAVEANLEKSLYGDGGFEPINDPPYSLETVIYFGATPNSFPECSFPNGESTWTDFPVTSACTDFWLSNMTWSFAKDQCGFAAIAGTRNYTQKLTVVRRYTINGVIERTEKSSRYLYVNFPSEIEADSSSVTVSFPEANAFAALTSIDYDPENQQWSVIVQTSLNNPYSIGSSVAAQYSGNLGLRAPTVVVSDCNAVDSACVQTITYTYPQGSLSDACLALSGTDLHTFSVQCTTPSCPGPNLFNITLRLNTGNACPSTDDISFSETSLNTFSDSSLNNQQDSFSVLDQIFVGASIQSTEAHITSRSLRPDSLCFKPSSGPCFYPAYTELPSVNGKDPVVKVDLTDSANAAYFGTFTTPTEFTVKASIVVEFSGAAGAGAKSTRAIPKTQTIETVSTAVIGGEKSSITSDAHAIASPFMLVMLIFAFLL